MSEHRTSLRSIFDSGNGEMNRDLLLAVAPFLFLQVCWTTERDVIRINAQDLPLRNRVVDPLVSNNKAPSLPGVRSTPSFGERYDWAEQERVWRIVSTTFKSAADNWDEIVAGMARPEYCVTVRTFNGSKYNWTVGDVCHKIASRTLSQAYYGTLKPKNRELYAIFREPAFASDATMLKDWLDERPRKPLAELQADACDWAIAEFTKRAKEDNESWSSKDRDRWIMEIKKIAAKLRTDGTPIRSDGFGPEEFVNYPKNP